MYRCEQCKSQSQPREKLYRTVVEIRRKNYEVTRRKFKKTFTVTSEGWEIAKETNLCKVCADKKQAA